MYKDLKAFNDLNSIVLQCDECASFLKKTSLVRHLGTQLDYVQ